MKSKLRPFSNSSRIVPMWFFPVVSLAVYAGLAVFSNKLEGMTAPPEWGLWLTSYSELIAAALLTPMALYLRKSPDIREILAAQAAIKTLNSLPAKRFNKKLSDTFYRMGYTVITSDAHPDIPLCDADECFKIITNTKVTLVMLHRNSLTGLPTVKLFLEKMYTGGAESGMILTTGLFTKPALKFAKSEPVVLLDGFAILSLLSKHRKTCEDNYNLSDTYDPFPVSVKGEPYLKEISPVCPACGSEMRISVTGFSKSGFCTYWACTQRPECNMTLDYELCP